MVGGCKIEDGHRIGAVSAIAAAVSIVIVAAAVSIVVIVAATAGVSACGKCWVLDLVVVYILVVVDAVGTLLNRSAEGG